MTPALTAVTLLILFPASGRGDPPTQKLSQNWRQHLEDVLWALINAPEWVYAP